MKEENNNQKHTCPRCGKEYRGVPALSRTDNKTNICPDCGTREALESLGVKPPKQDRILAAIHRSMGEEFISIKPT